ncbi:MAG: NADH-quinone oxidoreductase subunit M [Thermoplasmata archaeon]|nr:NADH-quinone oxidoreductase subunit M [Thermoplasmata archaeon]
MLIDFPIISSILIVSLLGTLLIYLFPAGDRGTKWFAVLLSLVPLALSTILLLGIVAPGSVELTSISAGGQEFLAYEKAEWIPQAGISFEFGVDQLSGPLVFLTSLLTTLGMIFSWGEKHRTKEFFAMLLFMQATVAGVFVSLDLFLFFVFWEGGLVPMYFLIAVWGGPKKKYASMKFFLFTQAASLLVLLGVLVFYWMSGTFSIVEIMDQGQVIPPGLYTDLLFFALLLGFGTKLPMVPLHTWLPDAHVEAPTAGSVLLAGVLLKMGGYGLLRFNVQLLTDFSDGALGVSDGMYLLVAVIGIVSIVYGAFVCLAQDDFKRLVAFSSVSHMGFVTLGIAAAVLGARAGVDANLAMTGAVFQLFAHGLISAALFMIAGALGHNVGTRLISKLHGAAKRIPNTAGFMMVAFMASLGLPGLVGFVAEFSVFLGVYQGFEAYFGSGLWVLIPAIAIVITAGYYLFAMQRAMFGPEEEDAGEMKDLHSFEILPLAVLIFFIALLGILPYLLFDPIHSWVGGLV